ncbi:FKBP-type peptidyl-prolyl cis-trans isomerase [Aestuariirhabdus sp. Z084]|uniref:FKBP-type peptidyl-prolyl cis-trans isomerase n=1 Tax=Aestuariirhabdus haliotis TaxID=2918751 RepID=UPI00201B3FF4|nr:FKBP-type peptidyl-prolyl cis-trans isomerase [Aestuariirhabdus haliotis]MCL6414376.1 FKBP-type peptidyl-prolyl cis-trans isomerase [Aestuariirhabdus haliotis]MCL6418308.1 FKBP-type peptidyl-prolyl cis-trans isomerase [Aestuariirhabdus haliotis]
MKLRSLVAAIALTSGVSGLAMAAELSTDEQKLSYSLGAVMGERLTADFDSLDVEALSQGIKDAMAGGDMALTREQMIAAIQQAQQQAQERAQQLQQEMAQKNLDAGNEFLAENGKKDGITTTESGLQYKVMTKGEGAMPEAGSQVTVHYEGRLLDGTVFDSSYERGETTQFGVNQVIPGWTEALQLMPKGSTWEVYIPSQLAYGPGGIPGKIGPNEVLVFKVELVDFE